MSFAETIRVFVNWVAARRGSAGIWIGSVTSVIIGGVATAYILSYIPPSNENLPDTPQVLDYGKLAQILAEDRRRFLSEQTSPPSTSKPKPETSAEVSEQPKRAPTQPELKTMEPRESESSTKPQDSYLEADLAETSPNRKVQPTAEQTPSDIDDKNNQFASLDPSPQAPVENVTTPEISNAPLTFLESQLVVFEGETFSLCNYSGFSAELSGSQIVLRSRDRNIPGRTFRGYEKKLQPETQTSLFSNCIVLASAYEASGTVRIGLLIKERQ